MIDYDDVVFYGSFYTFTPCLEMFHLCVFGLMNQTQVNI